jgi:hypothetical protein
VPEQEIGLLSIWRRLEWGGGREGSKREERGEWGKKQIPGQPGLHSNILSQKKEEEKKEEEGEMTGG